MLKLVNIIILYLISIGAADCVSRQYVFHRFREWVEKTFPYNQTFITLANCPVCQSFWTSFIVSFAFPCIFSCHPFLNAVFAGLGGVLVADAIFSRIDF